MPQASVFCMMHIPLAMWKVAFLGFLKPPKFLPVCWVILKMFQKCIPKPQKKCKVNISSWAQRKPVEYFVVRILQFGLISPSGNTF